MILTAKEIKKEVKKGNIIIDPFDEKCLKPNSYIYHLGDTLVEVLQVGDKRRNLKQERLKFQLKDMYLNQEDYTLVQLLKQLVVRSMLHH